MQVYISLQTDNHASTPPLKFFTGRMPFLPPNQQRQSTEGKTNQNKTSPKMSMLIISVRKQRQMQCKYNGCSNNNNNNDRLTAFDPGQPG